MNNITRLKPHEWRAVLQAALRDKASIGSNCSDDNLAGENDTCQVSSKQYEHIYLAYCALILELMIQDSFEAKLSDWTQKFASSVDNYIEKIT